MAPHREPTSAPDSASRASSASTGNGCLTENDVLDLVSDSMDPDARQRADAHVRVCSECRRLVSEAVRALAPDPAPVVPPEGASPVVLPQVGDIIEGKYEIERVVGHGGMGVVFAARHLMLEHPVALKFLWGPSVLSESSKQRFLREGRAALRIESDHIIRVMDVGISEQGAPFVVMELLQGCDVRSLLASDGPIPWREVVRIVLQALDAVGAAHDAGVVHRDLKPANLFLVQTQQNGRVKVLDFGVSKITSDQKSTSLTTTEAMLGSPVYMAPEQMEDASRVDARADVWSLGVTMFEMMTGVLPFGGATVAALHRAILDSKGVSVRERVPDVPKSIDAVIQRCLSVDPGERYANGNALRTALEEAMSDLEGFPQKRRPLSSRRALWLVAVATAVVALVLMVWSRPEVRPVSPVAAAPSSRSAQSVASPSGRVAEVIEPDGSSNLDGAPAASSVPRPLPSAAKRGETHATPFTPTAAASAIRPNSNLDPDPHAPGLLDRR